MKFKIYRYDGEEEDYDLYDVPHEEGQTVLDALFHIQENIDDSLSFRYSCRGAVCGSCAMLIDKVPRLACRTQVQKVKEQKSELEHYGALDEGAGLSEEHILVEPLPHLEVQKDLIVDMGKFYDNYEKIEPYLKPEETPEREHRMDPDKVSELEDYTNCILCAACFGACPVNGENDDYLGPAALAKLYRFHLDTRESEEENRLDLADYEDGWWACDFYTNCRKVCPKDVPPNFGIGKARQELEGSKDDKD
ncbi:MAG: succinate dehydrogenase/fumarate reductase iron-sulfur subunit [Thermoplasmata archaeon]